jgi:uncharacterized protein YfdQ (DUF2303 family)
MYALPDWSGSAKNRILGRYSFKMVTLKAKPLRLIYRYHLIEKSETNPACRRGSTDSKSIIKYVFLH